MLVRYFLGETCEPRNFTFFLLIPVSSFIFHSLRQPTQQPSHCPSGNKSPSFGHSLLLKMCFSLIFAIHPLISLAAVVVDTGQPSQEPSVQPSMQPSGIFFFHFFSLQTCITFNLNRSCLYRYTGQPSSQPSTQPSRQPNAFPSSQPSFKPSQQPTRQPTSHPTSPSGQPTDKPSQQPSRQPTTHPSPKPSFYPTYAGIQRVVVEMVKRYPFSVYYVMPYA